MEARRDRRGGPEKGGGGGHKLGEVEGRWQERRMSQSLGTRENELETVVRAAGGKEIEKRENTENSKGRSEKMREMKKK